MAFDGIFLSCIKKELDENIILSKIDKIYQPAKDEIILSLRGGKTPVKLLISANASYPRIHFTKKQTDNPQNPPMFCMFLRKHLMGARLLKVTQPQSERILMLDFEATNELFDTVTKTLIVEIMGRYSNIILTENGKILDSIKHVGIDLSSKRQILPGLKYEIAPGQDKIDLKEENNFENIFEKILPEERVDKYILNRYMGLSPVICREFCYEASKNSISRYCELSQNAIDKIKFIIKNESEKIKNNDFSPTLISEKNGKMIDISFMNVSQYGAEFLCEGFNSPSELCDEFYGKKSVNESIRQKGNDLLKLISVHLERQKRKDTAIKNDLLECEKGDYYRICGELITANIYLLQKGMNKVTLNNFYTGQDIDIALDYNKTPSQNAQKYFKEYQKTKTAKEYLGQQQKICENEINYLETVFDSLANAETSNDLDDIRLELYQSGYIKSRGKNQKNRKAIPMEFISSDGFKILAGKNNIQNDYLITKIASPRDMWLHGQKIPSSHVIIASNGETIPEKTLFEAAVICATHSKFRGAKKITVDYTLNKFVKKIPGAKAGMVTYSNFKSLIVDSDEKLCDGLRNK